MPGDTLSLDKGYQNAVAFYNKSLGKVSSLYSGRQYAGYDHRIGGHQYYHTNKLQKGSIKYSGILYENVLMRYELIDDIVLVTHADNDFQIVLKKSEIEWFRVNNHLFIHVNTDSYKGFYDFIDIGINDVLVKRAKQITEEIVDKKILQDFTKHNKYYIKSEEQIFPIASKKSLLNYAKKYKKEIKKMLKKENIIYRKDPESAIIAAMEYLEKI